jgi:hypothetical protein
MGSYDGGTYSHMKKLIPNANVLKGLPIEMSDAENGSPKAVNQWLKSLGFI